MFGGIRMVVYSEQAKLDGEQGVFAESVDFYASTRITAEFIPKWHFQPRFRLAQLRPRIISFRKYKNSYTCSSCIYA